MVGEAAAQPLKLSERRKLQSARLRMEAKGSGGRPKFGWCLTKKTGDWFVSAQRLAGSSKSPEKH